MIDGSARARKPFPGFTQPMIREPPAWSVHCMVGCKAPLWMRSKMAEAVSMVQGKPTCGTSVSLSSSRAELLSAVFSRAPGSLPWHPQLQAVLPGTPSFPRLSFFYEALNHAKHGSPSIVLSHCCQHKAVMGNRCQGEFAATQQGWRGQAWCQSTESLSFVNGFLTEGLSESAFPQSQLPSP